jgi:hypothetical protein
MRIEYPFVTNFLSSTPFAKEYHEREEELRAKSAAAAAAAKLPPSDSATLLLPPLLSRSFSFLFVGGWGELEMRETTARFIFFLRKTKWRNFFLFFSSVPSSFLPPPSLNVSISANTFPLSSGANSATRVWRFRVDGARLEGERCFFVLSRMLSLSLSLTLLFWITIPYPFRVFFLCLGGALLRRTYTKASSEVALYIAEDTSIREGTNRNSSFDTVVVLVPYGTT